MIYLILIFLAILICVDVWKNKKILTPSLVFNGMFFIVLFLYNFYLSDIQQVLSKKTILILFLCVIAFNIPIFIEYFKERKNNTEKSEKLFYNNFKNFYINQQQIYYVMHYLIVALFICELIYCGGCPFIWKLTGDARTYFDFGIPQVHMILCVLLTLMGSLTLLKKNDHTKYSYILIAILMVSRGLLMEIALGGIFCKILSLRTLKKEYFVALFVIGLVAVLMFSVMGNFRTGEETFLEVAKFKSNTDWIPTSFKWLYSYMCFSFSNLNNLFTITNGFVTRGKLIFSLCVPNFVKDFVRFETPSVDSCIVDPHFNVSTFIPELFWDFGIVGLFVFCLLLGYVMIKLDKMFRKEKAYQLLYAICLANLVFLCFSNRFLTVNFIIEVFAIIFYVSVKNLYLKNYYKKKRRNL